jgi:hypothetical protein
MSDAGTDIRPRIDFVGVAADAAARIEQVVQWLGLDGEIQGGEYVAYNPTRQDNHLGSFRIVLRGRKQGAWFEHAAGRGGDALSLIAYVRACSMLEAARAFDGALGTGDLAAPVPMVRRPAARRDDAETERKIARARALWISAEKDITGTPAEDYLLARLGGKRPERWPGSFRFSAACREPYDDRTWPALLAQIGPLHGAATGVHRTYLRHRDGVWGKAPVGKGGKAVTGGVKGGFIRIARGFSGLPIARAPADDVVAIAEGIETALSVAVGRPEWRVLAGVSVGNLITIDLPERLGAVVLCADNDEPGTCAAELLGRAAARWRALGHAVRLEVPEGDGWRAKDWNDALVGKVTVP